MKKLNESLDYLDMKDQLNDIVTVDEYAAKMGDDSSIVTLTFTVHSKLAAEDLVTWFERGYDWVLDASISDGEIEPGKWLVFVEMERRSTVPKRICTLLSDLGTLTEFTLDDWKVEVEGTETDADEEQIRNLMVLNPNEYKKIKQVGEEINEFRELAGLQVNTVYENDEYIKNLKAMAGM